MTNATALPVDPHSSPFSEPTILHSENTCNEVIQSEEDLPPHPQYSTVSAEKDARNKKRKRTSPEDHNILEQEYKRNPKPDKAARIEIVEKVKLTEKEVQIWFQNKRQISRRKSRPLLPHEIAAFGLGGMAALSSDPISSSSYGGSEPISPEAHYCSDASVIKLPDDTQKEIDISQKEKNVIKLEEVTTAAEMDSLHSHPLHSLEGIPNVELHANEQNMVDEALEFLPNVQTPRHNFNSSPDAPSSSQAPIVPTSSSNPHPDTSLPSLEEGKPTEKNTRSSSRMRLSLSLDGRAELAKVSPPRSHVSRPSSFDLGTIPRRTNGLQRSQSALPLGFDSNKLPASMRVPRLPTGRSRDARAWEFYADNEIRKERSSPAEHHNPTDSAVTAISLIRSASNSTLKLNQNKRNAAPGKPGDGKAVKKTKLSRASSSLARLQGSHENELLKPYRSKESSNFAGSPTGDSDKENWMSGENGSNFGRLTGAASQWPKQGRKGLLEATVNMPGFPSKLGSRKNKRRTSHESTSIFEDEVSVENVDPEVEKFMRGEISPGKKGDLDCVQGLLSLSQGNWR